MPPLLLLQAVDLTFGQSPLLTGAELSVGPRERLALVGRNGSGKSTLLKIAAGLVEPDSGTRFVQPGTTVRYLAQEPDFGDHTTVAAYVEAGLGEGDDAHRGRQLIEDFGLRPDADPRRLSGGEARRAALARVLAPEPDILLLDEPTNHLDLALIETLEETLKALRSSIVLISHDRRFLTNLTNATVWLDRGATRRLDRGFGAFEAWRDQLLEEEELARHKLDRKIAREEDWLRYGVSARRKRNQRRLADLHGLRAERKTRREGRPVGDVAFAKGDIRTAGKLVIEAEGISKRFGDRTVVADFSIKVERGDRVGFVGPNGAGKTTLIRMLTGDLQPDGGTVKLGTNLDVATLDQRRETLDLDTTVADTLTGGGSDNVVIAGQARHVVGYMKDFLFRPEQARTPVRALSGGERGRLMLARALARSANLLVLDEPTNDLDLETLDLLQEMLADYDGTLILVSHDRDFLDRVVTSTVASEGAGRWQEYAGGYSDMVAQRGHGIAARAAAPAPPPKPAEGAAPTAKPAAPKRKLTFNDQQALKNLPSKMKKLEDEIRRQERAIADPGLYARDPRGFAIATGALETARTALAAAEDDWLRLELLREEAGG
ncbi:MAG: ATP-binding cassette domain-containing protein [Bauldia sp.]|nr:ATP-binding cassette domain-containing protein [Bauldia sp.]